jgi:hypothetical protein
MKQVLMFSALAVASMASTTFAQTVANGPYYATPSWNQTLPVAQRFIVLANFNQEAVLDRETGLVWEREPDTQATDYSPAIGHCRTLVKGGRQGWRAPTNQEMRTLVQIGNMDGFTDQLPPGHPFIVPNGLTYWTTTYLLRDATLALMMRFTRPDTTPSFSKDLGNSANVWCVRAQAVSDHL